MARRNGRSVRRVPARGLPYPTGYDSTDHVVQSQAFDSTRPSSMAEMTYNFPLLDDRRRASHHLDLASLNAYYGWYFGKAEGIAAHMDRFHERNPGQGMLLSEYREEAHTARK